MRIDDPDAIEVLRRRAIELQIPQRVHSASKSRTLFVPADDEGFHVLGEGVALRAADIDVVWTSGYRFPRLSRWTDVPCRSSSASKRC